jgi:RimJ/RimL family protein N-acetyltransferase
MDWILYLAFNEAPIGNITADRPDTQTNSMELAFNLHPDFWGQGYMKEAVIEVMRHLFRLGFSNVLCGYSEGNRKSKRLIEKLGFQPYRTAENAWQKNGQPITEYTCILSREEFSALYGEI